MPVHPTANTFKEKYVLPFICSKNMFSLLCTVQSANVVTANQFSKAFREKTRKEILKLYYDCPL